MMLRVSEGVRVRAEEFGALVFTNRTPILALNADAFAIWRLIDGVSTSVDIIRKISAACTDATGVSDIVMEFLTSCADLGLIDLDDNWCVDGLRETEPVV